MTPRQIELVESSFDQVMPIADTAAELFYKRLFEIDPSLRALFTAAIRDQGRKLMDAISIIVRNLRNLERMVPGIRGLGARHVAYGVKSADYEAFGQALLETLQIGLGAGFTADVADAWQAAYAMLAATMTAGAAEMEPAGVS
jgi:hemoglobin-like flavoprotein